ncbi:hypothetical protein PybrP1_003928 [[Pythium] brassicae (nom. inval.)]|nr:hypothetical protein PybrP1_003928 [[Pythium] brassicae (nom. inval.)]
MGMFVPVWTFWTVKRCNDADTMPQLTRSLAYHQANAQALARISVGCSGCVRERWEGDLCTHVEDQHGLTTAAVLQSEAQRDVFLRYGDCFAMDFRHQKNNLWIAHHHRTIQSQLSSPGFSESHQACGHDACSAWGIQGQQPQVERDLNSHR